MKKIIQLVMYSTFIGQGMEEKLKASLEYRTILTEDYKNAEIYLRGASPHILLVETPDHPALPLGYCLALCDRYKRTYPDCKIMLFVTYTYMDDILQEVAMAKRLGRIDGFITGQMRPLDIVAQIQGLA